MKNNYHIKITFYQLIIFSGLFNYFLFLECNKDSPILKNNECVSTYCTEEQLKTGECIINEIMTKKKWMTSIIIVENTNGEIYLSMNDDSNKYLFGTTLSNKKDRLYYGLIYDAIEMQINNIFNYNNHPYLIINRMDNDKVINPEIAFVILSSEFIISIGTNNSKIELIKLDNYMDEYYLFSPNDFFSNENENKIIKGVSSMNYDEKFIYIAMTSTEEETDKYYLSLFQYKLSSTNNLILMYKNNFTDINDEYISCFVLYKLDNTISCIYLSKDGN